MKVRCFRFITLGVMVLLLGWTVNTTLAAEYSSVSDTAAFVTAEPTSQPAYRQQNPVVHAVLFWSSTCPHCHHVIDTVLPPLKEQYRDRFNLLLIEMKSQNDWELLAQTAAQFGISWGNVGVPFLVIGDRVLIGSGDIPAELPGLIDSHLANGGLGLPDIPGLEKGIPFSLPGDETCEAGTDCSETAIVTEQSKAEGHNLAIAIMVGMGAALAYVGVNTTRHFRGLSTVQTPKWLEHAIPWLAVVGLGVALYLAYVETQAVEAVCGPVGDCNAVQSSSYAKLFGMLPIGVLGAMGYIAILVAWLWSRLRTDQIADQVQQVVLAMTVFGTLFSLYLTYLEPFVIKAVCAWCLTSAVIITLLMLVNTTPTLQTVRVKTRRGCR
jgi:uncharacterized membrane protein/glutaredoxin